MRWPRAAGMIASRFAWSGACSDSARPTRGSSSPSCLMRSTTPTVDTVTRPARSARYCESRSSRQAPTTAS